MDLVLERPLGQVHHVCCLHTLWTSNFNVCTYLPSETERIRIRSESSIPKEKLCGSATPGLRIWSIFGRIRIQQIRILRNGSGSYWHLPRINSNIKIFFISMRFLQIFLSWFFFPEKWKTEKNHVKKLHFLFFLIQLNIAKVASGSGENFPDPTK